VILRGAQALALVAVAALLGLLIWRVAHQDAGAKLVDEIAAGDRPQAPDFSLRPLWSEAEGATPRLRAAIRRGTVSAADLTGRPTVVNVFASWCIPCKDEAPYLEQVWRSRRADGLVVLGLDARDFRSDARNFARRYDITFPLVYDGPGNTLPHYGVTGFPETYVLDREGRVVEAFVGAINSDEDHARLRSAVARALRS
jgi:cytochrome c biogenesis protein CcmG/thiol:disulfide interchange protein DsbE